MTISSHVCAMTGRQGGQVRVLLDWHWPWMAGGLSERPGAAPLGQRRNGRPDLSVTTPRPLEERSKPVRRGSALHQTARCSLRAGRRDDDHDDDDDDDDDAGCSSRPAAGASSAADSSAAPSAFTAGGARALARHAAAPSASTTSQSKARRGSRASPRTFTDSASRRRGPAAVFPLLARSAAPLREGPPRRRLRPRAFRGCAATLQPRSAGAAVELWRAARRSGGRPDHAAADGRAAVAIGAFTPQPAHSPDYN